MKKIIGLECKFVVQAPSNKDKKSDIHFVKEVAHFDDGTKEPRTRIIRDFKRPFWLTAPNFRGHKEKKEWERIERMMPPFSCTQADLFNSVKECFLQTLKNTNNNDPLSAYKESKDEWAKELFTQAYTAKNMRELCNIPYIYGADLSAAAMIKKKYMDKFPDAKSENSVAVLDIETDVVNKKYYDIFMTYKNHKLLLNSMILVDGKEIKLTEYNVNTFMNKRLKVALQVPILTAVTFKDKAICVATKDFISDMTEEEYTAKVHEKIKELAPEIYDDRKCNVEIRIADDVMSSFYMVFERVHQWRPDFLSIYNMNFDIPRILLTIEAYGGDPADIFCDPSVPDEYKYCYYKVAQAKKVTSSGKEMALPWFERWHTFFCPASFYIVDQPVAFKKLRAANGKEKSMSLDHIAGKYGNVRKLKDEHSASMGGLEWHIHKQQHDKIGYTVYNIWDCMVCEILDEQPKVGDLRLALGIQIDHSEYSNFNSQPRRTVDDLHYTCLENGYVIGTTSNNISTKFDDVALGRESWIVTLDTHRQEENGIYCLNDNPSTQSLIRLFNFDLDVSAAYPTGEDVNNTSKSTTLSESVKIDGVSEHQLRNLAVNMTGGANNAIISMVRICNAPTFFDICKAYEEKNGLVKEDTVVIPEKFIDVNLLKEIDDQCYYLKLHCINYVIFNRRLFSVETEKSLVTTLVDKLEAGGKLIDERFTVKVLNDKTYYKFLYSAAEIDAARVWYENMKRTVGGVVTNAEAEKTARPI